MATDFISGWYCSACHVGPQDRYMQNGACEVCGNDLGYINAGNINDDYERDRDERFEDMCRDQGC